MRYRTKRRYRLAHAAFEAAEKAVAGPASQRLMGIKGTQSPESFHKRLGKIMWDKCGMARNEEGLKDSHPRGDPGG